LGYDNERMAFGFSMLNGGEEVQCQISAAAIDELVGGPRGSYVDRETQLSQLRETIERPASAKFDASAVVRGSVIRILARYFRKQHDGTILAHRLGRQRARSAFIKRSDP